MERITYRKTLDVHKSGSQFLLQGFQTADNMSRVIEISLMASGDAVDFPLERIVAMMYVTTPGAKEPSINDCTIKDNKIVYEVLPIVTEGITTMQLKLIEAGPDGATSVLASPEFSVEVAKSGTNDGKAEQTTTFTALEDAMAKAKVVYDERFLRMELSSDCIFRAYYADGTLYETDVLQKLFLNGNVLLSESFAHGGTGVRAGEDTDNSKYYSDVARSEALNAKNIMSDSEEILEEVKLHGVYTAFSVNFETGEVEYVTPSFKFNVNPETGELDAEGQTYTFEEEIGRVVEAWLGERGVTLDELQAISTRHTTEIGALQETVTEHSANLETLNAEIQPIERGGTGATTKEDALINLGVEPRLSEAEEEALWVTLGSVSYEQTYTQLTFKGGASSSDALSETNNLVIPGNEELLKEFTNFRYVLKKGSTFRVSTTEAEPDSYWLDMIVELKGCEEVLVALKVEGHRTNNPPSKIEFTCKEDEIIHLMNIGTDSIVFDNKVTRGGTTNSPSKLYELSCHHHLFNVKAEDEEQDTLTSEASFTIELQGKR